MTTYFEKLKDPRWQQRRLEILKRDGWACVACGDKEKTLHVHHRYYMARRDPWCYPGFALVTLCESCHSVESMNEPEWNPNSIRAWELTMETLFTNGGHGAAVLAEVLRDLRDASGLSDNEFFKVLPSALRSQHVIELIKGFPAFITKYGLD